MNSRQRRTARRKAERALVADLTSHVRHIKGSRISVFTAPPPSKKLKADLFTSLADIRWNELRGYEYEHRTDS